MPRSTGFTEWLADIAVVATAFAVLAALLFAWLEVRAVRETRQSQAMSAYFERWSRRSLRKARRHAAHTSARDMLIRFEAALIAASSEYYMLKLIPDFFEDLALSVKYGEITLESVNDWIGSEAVHTWERWKLVAEELRRGTPEFRGGRPQPAVYENFELLAHDVLALRAVRIARGLRSRLWRTRRGALGTRIRGRPVFRRE